MPSNDYTERRREILGKLRWNEKLYFRKLPQRKEAVLTEDPRHNPLILEECPRCRGCGQESRYDDQATPKGPVRRHLLTSCLECCGLGTTGDVVRYFPEDPPPVEAVVAPNGWLRCPGCRRSLCIHKKTHWTGMRHATCGQRINLVPPANAPVEDSQDEGATEAI